MLLVDILPVTKFAIKPAFSRSTTGYVWWISMNLSLAMSTQLVARQTALHSKTLS